MGNNSSAEGSEATAKEYSAPVTISLSQGDTLCLAGIDKSSSYNDNPGEVIFEVLFFPQHRSKQMLILTMLFILDVVGNITINCHYING
ncbi:MAG: hypothetical protein KDE48_13950 [Anaerolineales bacterium]|nr:hypothetical protein [Anaerolineales bacterium]